MSRLPASITYRWVARDNDILDGKDPFEKTFVTPYKINRARFSAPKQVGELVSFDLQRASEQPAYLRLFAPAGFSWQDIPPGYEDCATLGELCQRLMAGKAEAYPAKYYAAPQKPYRYGALSLLQMMVNVWDNTEFRWALVSGGWSAFSWTMLGANGGSLLGCPT